MVLPLPVPPATRMTSPLGNPPSIRVSKPLIPVGTRSLKCITQKVCLKTMYLTSVNLESKLNIMDFVKAK